MRNLQRSRIKLECLTVIQYNNKETINIPTWEKPKDNVTGTHFFVLCSPCLCFFRLCFVLILTSILGSWALWLLFFLRLFSLTRSPTSMCTCSRDMLSLSRPDTMTLSSQQSTLTADFLGSPMSSSTGSSFRFSAGGCSTRTSSLMGSFSSSPTAPGYIMSPAYAQ